MKATTFLEIHNALLNKEYLEQCRSEHIGLYNGLCYIHLNYGFLKDNYIFKVFEPLEYCDGISDEIVEEDKNKYADSIYWASSIVTDWGVKYTPLRQNIILLCAAMNGEL